MRLRRTVLTSALTVALATSLVAPAVEASAQTTYTRTTHVSLSSRRTSDGKLHLTARSGWRHTLRNGQVNTGTAAGLPLVFQTYRSGKWVVIYRGKTYANGAYAIVGTPRTKARYRVLLKPITIGQYHYTGSKSKVITA